MFLVVPRSYLSCAFIHNVAKCNANTVHVEAWKEKRSEMKIKFNNFLKFIKLRSRLNLVLYLLPLLRDTVAFDVNIKS